MWGKPTTSTPLGVDVVIGYGSLGPTAGVLADRLTVEEVFPVCIPRLAKTINRETFPQARLLHRVLPPVAARNLGWPDWPTFLDAVRIDHVGPTAGSRVPTALLRRALLEGKGVALFNTTSAHDELVSGGLVRPIPESMKTDSAYWVLVSEAQLAWPEVLAFRDWLKDEIAACFGVPVL